MELHTYIATSQIINQKTYISTYDCHLRSRFGGQLEDWGDIYLNGWHSIADIIINDGRRVFQINEIDFDLCKPNTPIILRLNEKRRQEISAMHTSIHLLCSLADQKVIRGYAGPDISKIEFEGEINDFNKKIEGIKKQMQDYVHSNIKVEVMYKNIDEIKKIGLVEEVGEIEKSINQVLRIVNIHGVDLRACNGTHVENTRMLMGIGIDSVKVNGFGKFSVRLKKFKIT